MPRGEMTGESRNPVAPQPLSFLCWPEWGGGPILLGSSPACPHPAPSSLSHRAAASTLDTPSSLPSPGLAPPAFSTQDTLPRCLWGTGQSFLSVCSVRHHAPSTWNRA